MNCNDILELFESETKQRSILRVLKSTSIHISCVRLMPRFAKCLIVIASVACFFCNTFRLKYRNYDFISKFQFRSISKVSHLCFRPNTKGQKNGFQKTQIGEFSVFCSFCFFVFCLVFCSVL